MLAYTPFFQTVMINDGNLGLPFLESIDTLYVINLYETGRPHTCLYLESVLAFDLNVHWTPQYYVVIFLDLTSRTLLSLVLQTYIAFCIALLILG